MAKKTKLATGGGFARHVSRWHQPMEKPPVDLKALMVEIEAYGRPLHRVAQVRNSFGVPSVNRELEERLQYFNFWPKDARPLWFDIADCIYMLSDEERVATYAYLLEIPKKVTAQQMGWTYGKVDWSEGAALRHLWLIAECLGVFDGHNHCTDGIITKSVLRQVLGHRGDWLLDGVIERSGVERAPGSCAIYKRDFFTLWQSVERFEDMDSEWLPAIRGYVHPDVYRQWKSGALQIPVAFAQ